jgi:hypothetical protein
VYISSCALKLATDLRGREFWLRFIIILLIGGVLGSILFFIVPILITPFYHSFGKFLYQYTGMD